MSYDLQKQNTHRFTGPNAVAAPATFPSHRLAALSLLSGDHALDRKEAGFLGHVCIANALSPRQWAWLQKLLARCGLPSLIEGGAQ
ncbi:MULTISPECIES: hypothetical protein [unclassified Caulobacter]|uniref:hypothetical protein n=1 Tax=unclassified Caulobacter TaxID=2648921 RepID=UPI000D371D2A|nr:MULTISPECIES: hypothetical protein [unclassified Caulobacter]PTS86170.1 hypothetical protein DBR21_14925 [Caulobacter sp. HMWF009]PTT11835.1 hypothetical protein DBR10_02865 [Caulobacter sp. HMWF025]